MARRQDRSASLARGTCAPGAMMATRRWRCGCRGLGAVPVASGRRRLSEGIGGRLSAPKQALIDRHSALKQPLLGAPAARGLTDEFEERVAALRAAHPGKSTAELRAMARTVVATPRGVPEDLFTYTVGVGDTLASIALRHGTRVDQIRRWNKMLARLVRGPNAAHAAARPPTRSGATHGGG